MVPATDKSSTSADEARRQRSALGQAIMLGTNVAAGMIFFVLVGYYMDYRRGGDGRFWTAVGAIMGLIYAGYEFWTTVRSLTELLSRKPGNGATADKPEEPGKS